MKSGAGLCLLLAMGAPDVQDRDSWERSLEELESRTSDPDVLIFAKGVRWALRYPPRPSAREEALLRKSLDRGQRRAAEVAQGRRSWATKRGRVLRAFRSAVDDSLQPYGIVVPASYSPEKPLRLDVVLHGSQQPDGLSELRFIDRFADGEEPDPRPPEADYLELHPLGRVENGYRWSGETDVFEAIEAACRSYAIDRRRVVLRGMSAGASGTWHLGLKHPDRFVALGPYCGYVDTHRFSETPVPSFVKVGTLPPYQEKTLTMLDSIGYAANAAMVPEVACVGDRDVFFGCHVLMEQAMAREGLEMVNLISPGTGHVIDPPTFREQMRRIALHAERGVDPAPRHVRFVTWTLKYSRCFWLEAIRLKEHYVRAELEGRIDEDGGVTIQEPRNVAAFAIHLPAFPRRLRVGQSSVDPPAGAGAGPVVLEQRDGAWRLAGAPPGRGKAPGLQGPIDDAFSGPFLCVRGTGRPWNPGIQEWADSSLKRFAEEWAFHFRGNLPLKDDTQVTEEDLRRRHLILFGDPGSNAWIARVLSGLPLRWTPKELEFRGSVYPSATHAPVLISASPLPGAEGRYVVLNSGHSFHAEELRLNYLIFPRLGDWAVFRLGAGAGETPVEAGLFDERWN